MRCSCGLPQSPVPPVDRESQERILCDIFYGESFKAQRDDVRRMFDDDVRMLAVYLYADGTTLSTSVGMLLFFASRSRARRVLQHAKCTQRAAWSTLVRPYMLTLWTFVLRQCCWHSFWPHPIEFCSCLAVFFVMLPSVAVAVSAYPIRMRVVNIVTSKVGWYTVAYVPSVAPKHEPMSKPKAAQARAEL